MIVNPFLGNARILFVRWLTGIIESFNKLIAIGIDIEINANGGVFAWPVKIIRLLEACRGKICILIDWNTDQRGAGDCSPPRSQIIKYLPFYVIVMVNNLYVKFDKYTFYFKESCLGISHALLLISLSRTFFYLQLSWFPAIAGQWENMGQPGQLRPRMPSDEAITVSAK